MTQTLSTILHDLFLVTVTAASIFVKNPNSQQQAASLISLANGLLNQVDPETGAAKATN
jgi:hypothetical protein